MIKTPVKILLFALLCFLLIEQSYRVYTAGSAAFNPWRFNSLNMMPRTGLVKLSQYPDVYYELKPNLDDWFAGVRFRTNSAGLADREYTLEKPAETFRVAVVGSSWTMATGVAQQSAYHAVMEEMLNERYPGKRFEFLNFGVEMYGLREIAGTVRHRAMQWDPDLVLVSITTYTSYLKWVEPTPDQQLPERFNPFFSSYVLRALDWHLKTDFIPRTLEERPIIGRDHELGEQQVRRALREIDAATDPAGVPVAVMFLSFLPPADSLDTAIQSESDTLGLHYIRAYRAISGNEEMIRKRSVSPTNKHPNAKTHKILAEYLLAELQAKNLIPEVDEYQ